ncbi:heat shock protein 21 [Penaeus vannamei]|uniref:Heat shock protein 21 n=1 Tax=Penaeus vannamei TaxID=6689 RepID=A0A423U005_PENVA|nr:heat shock protein 21 [Penaeus vannamei]
MSAHSFRRRFSLPHLTDMTAITSVMSSDGILTINVPEVEEDARQKATVIPVHVEKTENSSRMQNWESSNTSSTASAEATSVQGKSLEVDQEECECARCSLENRCQAKNTQIPLSNASHSRTEEGVSASKQSSSVFTKSSQNEGAEIGSYGSWDTFLPITRRGNFFKDSFFSDIHQDFNSAIKEVLERWNDTDLRLRDRWDGADFLDHYRQLRSRDLKEENQAVTVASGNSSYKNGKAQQAKSIPVTVEGKRAVSQESSSSSTKTSVTNESVKERKEDCECLHSSKTSEEKTSQKPNGMKIPIQIIGSVTKESEKARSSSADTYVSSQENVSQTQVQEQKQRKAETITSKESSAATSTSVNRERQSGEKRECESQEKSSLVESTSCHESGSKFIPIRRRGLFFSDSVFQDTRDDFHRAIKEVLRSWGEESSMFDALTSYRNLRSRDLREENQAVTSLEDESYHKKPTIAIQEVKVPVTIEEKGSKSHTEIEDEIMSSEGGSHEASSAFNISTEGKTKREAHNVKETSAKASSRFSSVDTASFTSNESQTRRHVIPVHYEVGNESDSLEQLDQQRQVTVRDSRVSDDAGKSECEAKVSSDSLKSKRKCASGSSYLPIIRKGLFSEDHFFENVRQNYSEAVKEVLESANEWSCERDAMQVYRNLRQRNLQVENQAFSVTEDEHTHKRDLVQEREVGREGKQQRLFERDEDPAGEQDRQRPQLGGERRGGVFERVRRPQRPHLRLQLPRSPPPFLHKPFLKSQLSRSLLL